MRYLSGLPVPVLDHSHGKNFSLVLNWNFLCCSLYLLPPVLWLYTSEKRFDPLALPLGRCEQKQGLLLGENKSSSHSLSSNVMCSRHALNGATVCTSALVIESISVT